MEHKCSQPYRWFWNFICTIHEKYTTQTQIKQITFKPKNWTIFFCIIWSLLHLHVYSTGDFAARAIADTCVTSSEFHSGHYQCFKAFDFTALGEWATNHEGTWISFTGFLSVTTYNNTRIVTQQHRIMYWTKYLDLLFKIGVDSWLTIRFDGIYHITTLKVLQRFAKSDSIKTTNITFEFFQSQEVWYLHQ